MKAMEKLEGHRLEKIGYEIRIEISKTIFKCGEKGTAEKSVWNKRGIGRNDGNYAR
jgi:hypothetical protein